MVEYKIIGKSDFLLVAPILFDILHSNMSLIVPTGNSYENDCELWIENVNNNLNNTARKIILISVDDDIVGFFMYSISNDDTLNMEEIQLLSAWHGKHNIFRGLYGYVISIMPDKIRTVASCARKENIKSYEIQKHIGLKQISEDKNHFYFQGAYDNLLKWYNRTNEHL